MNYNRFDKIEWLHDTCSKEFLDMHLMQEMVRWMPDDEFEKFYATLCSHWDIKRDPNDPNYDPEVDSMED